MLKHKTKSAGSLDKIDTNNIQIGKYGELHGNASICCNLCSNIVAVDHGDMSQVNQHEKTKDHKLKSDICFSNS